MSGQFVQLSIWRGWARHFEHEYIIKLSKKDITPYQLNLMLNRNQGLALFREARTLRRHTQGSQHRFLFTMFSFSTPSVLISISCRYSIPDD